MAPRERQIISAADVGTLRVGPATSVVMDGSQRQFTALGDFFSDETRSQYSEGLTYTAHTKKLDQLVDGWVTERKVRLGGPVSEVSGAGVVRDQE